MEIDEIKRKTVARLREVKKQQDLSISKIVEMLEAQNCYISEATVKRLFSENSDPLSFKYRDTIAPMADVLLDLYSDKSNCTDIEALKAMIHDKNKTINILIARDEERKAEYEKRIAEYQKRIDHYQEQIGRLDDHLMFRERVIEQKDKIVEKLLEKVLKE